MAGGAVLGLDVGDARIGLARADAASQVAFGRGAIERSGVKRDVEAVARLAAEEGADVVVVGLPRSMDGPDSPQTPRGRAFAPAPAERPAPARGGGARAAA